jgi:hypothetical protein
MELRGIGHPMQTGRDLSSEGASNGLVLRGQLALSFLKNRPMNRNDLTMFICLARPR